MADLLKRRDLAVGLGEGVRHTLSLSSTQILRNEQYHGEIPLEVDENYARSKVEQRPLVLVIIDYYSSLKILLCYLISLSSLITIGLSVGMTLYWYERMQNVSFSSKLFQFISHPCTWFNWLSLSTYLLDKDKSIDPPGLDWVLLSFVLITPLSVTICLVFRRREDALIEIAKFRPLAYQLFLSHCIWDWGVPPKGKAAVDIDWVEHANDVLREMIAIGDELCRFLTLPTMSRCRWDKFDDFHAFWLNNPARVISIRGFCDVRHRMTTSGRREAARTAAVSRAHCFYCEFNWLIRIIVNLNLPSASLIGGVQALWFFVLAAIRQIGPTFRETQTGWPWTGRDFEDATIWAKNGRMHRETSNDQNVSHIPNAQDIL